MDDSDAGASNNERLLAAARADNQDMLLEIFEAGGFDINFQDGLGNTGALTVFFMLDVPLIIVETLALHIAVSHGSTDVLEHILSHEECDVDPINRIDKATPLHLAVQIEDPELRLHVVDSLLEAGADTRIKDKNGETAQDLVPPNDLDVLTLFRKSQAQQSVSMDDVANDEDDEGGSGSGSGSDDD
ncbi:ankyrin repeat-containing domain protein [Mucidula mucida]|nr:ankyrin repeat-containing domain protein [Mucidula mucida]